MGRQRTKNDRKAPYNLFVAPESDLETAQANYDKQKFLVDSSFAAASSLAACERALSTAKAAYESQRLAYASVKAQSAAAGVVAEILVEVGDLVSPSSSIAYVVDTDPMLLVAPTRTSR